jgi:hypothetical protein
MTGSCAHRPSKVVSFGTALIAACLAIGAGPKTATADGGVVRISEQQGEYRITVLSSPNPFRAGPVEISILVQDAATREPARDVDIIVGITARDRPELTYRAKALPEVAANRLFRAARFDLSESGTWHVDVEVPANHARKSARAEFDVEVGDRLPRWRTFWPWFSWPAVVVFAFCLRQAFASRRAASAVPDLVHLVDHRSG